MSFSHVMYFFQFYPGFGFYNQNLFWTIKSENTQNLKVVMQVLHHWQKEGVSSSEAYNPKYFNVFQIIYSKKPVFKKKTWSFRIV